MTSDRLPNSRRPVAVAQDHHRCTGGRGVFGGRVVAAECRRRIEEAEEASAHRGDLHHPGVVAAADGGFVFGEERGTVE